MRAHYYAVRPFADVGNTRIHKAVTPQAACQYLFGTGRLSRWEWKDLGTRVEVIQSDRKRIALLTSASGWVLMDELEALRLRLRAKRATQGGGS